MKFKEEEMFEIGDLIVYPMHGAGEIVDIEEKTILGKAQKYIVIKLSFGDMRLMLPLKKCEEAGLRYIVDGDEIEDVYKILEQESTKMPDNWNKRYRSNMDLLRTGDIYEVAKVYRNLKRLDDEKNLSTGEKKLLHDSKEILISEISLSSGKTYEEVDETIVKAVGF